MINNTAESQEIKHSDPDNQSKWRFVLWVAVVLVCLLLAVAYQVSKHHAADPDRLREDVLALKEGADRWRGFSDTYTGIKCNHIASGGYTNYLGFSDCDQASPFGGDYVLNAKGSALEVIATHTTEERCASIETRRNGIFTLQCVDDKAIFLFQD